MNCTDFLAKLTDFFDDNIEHDLLAEVKEHLDHCHHCEVVVDTTRHTIDIYRGNDVYEFPEELSERLRSAVMTRCEAAKAARSSASVETADATGTSVVTS